MENLRPAFASCRTVRNELKWRLHCVLSPAADPTELCPFMFGRRRRRRRRRRRQRRVEFDDNNVSARDVKHLEAKLHFDVPAEPKD